MACDPAPSIAQLNDYYRRTTGEMLFTIGARALPDPPGLVQAVRTFDAFTPDNDPWDEHDFGALTWHTASVFWKIDYYDQQLHSRHDPRAPDCRRVLTIMLADEY